MLGQRHTHTCTRIYSTQSLTGRLLSPSLRCCNWLSLFTNVAPSDSHISSRLINCVGVTMSVLVCGGACVCICASIYVGVTGVPIPLMSSFHTLIYVHAKRANGC